MVGSILYLDSEGCLPFGANREVQCRLEKSFPAPLPVAALLCAISWPYSKQMVVVSYAADLNEHENTGCVQNQDTKWLYTYRSPKAAYSSRLVLVYIFFRPTSPSFVSF